MSESNALPTPPPSTALLVEINVPGFIRVNIPKADAEKLYQSLGVTLGHRPHSTHPPEQSWDLNVMRIDKKLAGLLESGRSALGGRLTQIRRDIATSQLMQAGPEAEEIIRKLREEEAMCSEVIRDMTARLEAMKSEQSTCRTV